MTSDEQRAAWRCFHCDEMFTDKGAALEHFGRSESADPACQINIKRFREMEELLARWQAEDTDLHRHIYRLNADHAVALRREEELGYARGLKDGTSESAQQAPQARADGLGAYRQNSEERWNQS